MATKKWFVVEGDTELGPLGPNGLRKLVKKGDVLPGSMVRREDHPFPVRADCVRGLFDDRDSRAPVRSRIHGPFTPLRTVGWAGAAALVAWMAIGIWGAFTAFAQREAAAAIEHGADRPLAAADAPFLGLGGTMATVLFLATGVLFVYWLWNARVNLPHLIQARVRFAPSWTIAAWFVPPLNLLRPLQVLDEVDRLSAEAAADGDASVRGNALVLLPWWLATLLFVGLAVAYQLVPHDDVRHVVEAARLHLFASLALALAAGFGAVLLLRITRLQELAHEEHASPVQLHHEFSRRSADALEDAAGA